MPPLAIVVILALATYRLTRLFTADRITQPLRDTLFNWAYKPLEGGADLDAWLLLNPDATDVPSHVPRGWEFRTWVHDLITCDQCLGVWWGCAVYVAWWQAFHVETDVVEALLTIMAVCGVQSLLAWAAGLMQKGEERLDTET